MNLLLSYSSHKRLPFKIRNGRQDCNVYLIFSSFQECKIYIYDIIDIIHLLYIYKIFYLTLVICLWKKIPSSYMYGYFPLEKLKWLAYFVPHSASKWLSLESISEQCRAEAMLIPPQCPIGSHIMNWLVQILHCTHCVLEASQIVPRWKSKRQLWKKSPTQVFWA